MTKSEINSEVGGGIGEYAMTSGGGHEDGRSHGGYEVMSSVRNTQGYDPSVFSSRGRRAKRQIKGLEALLRQKI